MKATLHEIEKPNRDCEDPNCPFHGKLRVRGQAFVGTVASSKVPKSAVVVWDRKVKIQKYERFEMKRSRVAVHAPECIDIKEGDIVLIMETRPISKTKKFVIVQKK